MHDELQRHAPFWKTVLEGQLVDDGFNTGLGDASVATDVPWSALLARCVSDQAWGGECFIRVASTVLNNDGVAAGCSDSACSRFGLVHVCGAEGCTAQMAHTVIRSNYGSWKLPRRRVQPTPLPCADSMTTLTVMETAVTAANELRGIGEREVQEPVVCYSCLRLRVTFERLPAATP